MKNAFIRAGEIAIAIFIIAAASACNKDSQNVYQGYMEGDYLYISSSIGGKVEKIFIEKGDRLNAGTLLFELDHLPEQASYEEARDLLELGDVQFVLNIP